MQQIGFAYGFFERKLLLNQPERFGTVERATIGRNHFIERKDALGLRGGPFCKVRPCS